MATATLEAIRDRVYTLIEALTPSWNPRNKFVRYRNEEGADFRAWVEKNIAGAFRRVQAREASDDNIPLVSDTVTERVQTAIDVLIAYPQTARTGNANAMDRDDVMNQDWKLINAAIGIYGRGNFSGSNDCVPLGCVKSVEHASGVDFLVVRMSVEYLRAIT